MSDLISRSELLKAFNDKNIQIQITFDLPVEEVLGEDVDLDDFAMLVKDAIQAYKKMVIDTIKNMPTAYDIDKVVKELNQRKIKLLSYAENYEKTGDFEQAEIYSQLASEYTIAIEIVKQGGVSDDVFKWKFEETNGIAWHCDDKCTTYNQVYIKDLKITLEDFECKCPYCRKKIKVVE